MKKALLVFVLLFVFLIAFSACNSAQEPSSDKNTGDETHPCEHTFGEWVAEKEASCKDEGLLVRFCDKCDASEELSVPKLKTHSPVTDAGYEATCKAMGLTEGSHCTVCAAILVEQESIPKLKHQFVDAACKVCGTPSFSEGLLYEEIDGGYKMIGLGTCRDEEVIVPSTYNGLPVLAIGSRAFEITPNSNTVTKSIVLREGIKVLESNALSWCKAVESIDLPDSLEKIGDGAFCSNESLKSIVIPEKVTIIPSLAFSDCKRLRSVTLGSQVVSINNYAFFRSDIRSITLPETITHIAFGAFKESSLETCIIPKSLIYLGEEAFKSSAIESIDFAGNLTFISKNAFEDCNYLESVTFNSSIKRIDEGAFDHCIRLKTVVFSEGLTKIGKESFTGCAITKLALPEGLLSIGEDAFRNNEKLTELLLPSTITEIGKSAFFNCKSLKELTVPKSLENVGEGVFTSCGIESLRLEEGTEVIYRAMFIDCKNLKTVILPSTLKEIHPMAFRDCTSLTFSALPTSLVLVDTDAFQGCTFKDFVLTAAFSEMDGLLSHTKIENLTFDKDVTKIANRLFAGTPITSMKIPEGVTEIGESAFINCSKLNELSLPSTLLRIGEGAFQGCEAISTLTLPTGLKFIGANAFNGLKLIEKIELPSSLEEIGEDAFAYCSTLSEITVPNINLEGVFKSGVPVRTVHFNGTTQEAQTYICKAFPYGSSATIYCSDGIPILEVYTINFHGTNISMTLTDDGNLTIRGNGEVPYLNLFATTTQKNYGIYRLIKKVVIEEGITKINRSVNGQSSFDRCAYIEEIEFPSTMVAIDKEMFSGTAWHQTFNSGTTPVYIGDRLTMVPTSLSGSFTVKEGTVTISKHAFFGCAALTEIVLPLSVTTIEDFAFYGCEKLEKLTLHEGIKTLGRQAIDCCHSLTEITIPSTVTVINGPIGDCQNLKTVILADSEARVLKGSIVAYCSSVETVIIDAGVTDMPINTLYACPSLKHVIIKGKATKIDFAAFGDIHRKTKFLCYDAETASILEAHHPEFVYQYSESEPSEGGYFWGYSENGDIKIYQ